MLATTTNNSNTTTTTTSTSAIANNTTATTTNALSKATTSFTSLTNMIRNASSLSTMAASAGGPSNGQQESTETPQVNFKISLEVPLMTPDRLYPTPSMKDNLPFEVEFDLRLMGCELIQTAGRLLKLPQTAMATAQVLFHRYFYTKSFVKNPMEYYAMASIFLSSKIEECPRRVRDVMNVFYHIKQLRNGMVIRPMPVDENYYETKNQIIKAERRILKELGFCVYFKHPHKVIFIYLRAMDFVQSNIIQKSWNYMSDSFRTDVFLRYSPENIACACIYLSARELQIPLPQNPPWYTVFGADEQSLKAISVRILHLYSHKTKSQEELEKIVKNCLNQLNEEKRRLKEATSTSVLSSTTTKSTANSSETTTSESVHKQESIQSKSANDQVTTLTNEQIKLNQVISKLTRAHSNTPPQPSSTLPSALSTTQQKDADTSSQILNPNPYTMNMPYDQHPPYHGPPGSHRHQHHGMTRHASFNYYDQQHYHHHHSEYYHNGGHVNYDSSNYYNENYYEGNMKRNKSASYLPSAHDRDYDSKYSMHKRTHDSKERLTDRSSKYESSKYEYSKSKSSHRHYSHSRSRSASKSRSRSPSAQKKNRRSKRTSRSRSRTRSRSRSYELIDENGAKSSDKHKKHKKSSHRHRDETSGSGRDKHNNNDRREHDRKHDHVSKKIKTH